MSRKYMPNRNIINYLQKIKLNSFKLNPKSHKVMKNKLEIYKVKLKD